ncbi:Peptidase family M28 [Clostridium sp. DSM 8431]|uniref:M28 family metallopeptidase n=1 Tax=Clostridium sp. DSM 8431 TaxID=1761781 RepID=UPI0008EC24B6|nr:M28 family metallopeptidase [Clostridium sp. DSM 8431]SFU79794.1 Peptidase family M28 [Clostridium sp. DSM 8431]
MKRKIYNLITLTSIFLLVACICCRLSYKKFDSSNIKKNIDYISSEEFKGRLAGSSQNTLLAKKIENNFKDLKLKPLDDSYEDKFSTTIPKYTCEKSSLKLINKDNSSFEFTLGKDFKEDFLSFKKSSIQFTKDDQINIFSNGFSIYKDNIEYLFYVNLDKTFSFRSSFYEDSKYGFVIQISTNTFSKILDSLREGAILDVDLPYTTSQEEIFNVVGMIEGYSKNLPPLILTAHFDHVGEDSLGNYYPGALDNASGISFLLELAKNYSSLRIPKRDIIFIALNAEELGLKGSEAFASKYKDRFKGATVINFDMVGIDNYPITLMSGKDSCNTDSPLLKDLRNICESNNLELDKCFADSSDHASFINNNFDAITVSHCDLSNIHTPNDTSDKISENALDSVYDVVNKEVFNLSYNDVFLLFYDNRTLILLICYTSVLVCYGLIKRKKAKEK